MTKQGQTTSALQGKRILPFLTGSIAIEKIIPFIIEARKRGAIIDGIVISPAGEEMAKLTWGQLQTIKNRNEPIENPDQTIWQALLDLFGGDESKIHTNERLWRPENNIEHIDLTRQCDIPLVFGATADILSLSAHKEDDDLNWDKILHAPNLRGLADDHGFLDLLTRGSARNMLLTTLLACDKPITIVPAMNWKMWDNFATQNAVETLAEQGYRFIGPIDGPMACGESGLGRLQEVTTTLDELENNIIHENILTGLHVLITAGPTYEPLDPIRGITNLSSGKQGYAFARAAANMGARVTLVSGPVALPKPPGVDIVRVRTAQGMLKAVQDALPADIAVFTAAVADWRSKNPVHQKTKKRNGKKTPDFGDFEETPDILKTISNHPSLRPSLVIGFAAETNKLDEYAEKKLKTKGCDWIVGNKVAPVQSGIVLEEDWGKTESVMGGDNNTVTLFRKNAAPESWPTMPKPRIAARVMTEASKAVPKPAL